MDNPMTTKLCDFWMDPSWRSVEQWECKMSLLGHARPCCLTIGLTRKTGSTTAYQPFLPINKQKRWMFWNLPYPLGIADIRRQDMIDLDECGIELSTADRSIGKPYTGRHMKQSGVSIRNQTNSIYSWQLVETMITQ